MTTFKQKCSCYLVDEQPHAKDAEDPAEFEQEIDMPEIDSEEGDNLLYVFDQVVKIVKIDI